MGTTKVGLTNRIESATLMNGTGGGAPALIENSPYVMSNTQNTDRYKVWQSSILAATTAYNIDFDLGANRSISAVAMLGFRLGSGNFMPYMDVFYQTGAYAPAGVWTYYYGTQPNVRDIGATFGTITARSIRFMLTTQAGPTTQFSLGKFWAGAPTDLTGIHDPGGTFAPYQNRLETPTPSGAVVLSGLGDEGADWVLPWKDVSSSVRTSLLTMQGAAGSFLLIDADGDFYEVYARGGRVDTARNLGTRFDANLELSRMP